MSKEAEVYKKQLNDALKTSKQVIDILKAISLNSDEDLSKSVKAELRGLSEEINSLILNLKTSCNKALTLSENVASLNSVKSNIKDFDDSFERFKSLSAREETRKY